MRLLNTHSSSSIFPERSLHSAFVPIDPLARLVRSAKSVGLSIQFVKQGFCLAERGRVEAFREPAVDFGEQALRLGSAALGFEPSREGRCPLQLVVLCALDARAFQRSAIGGLDR